MGSSNKSMQEPPDLIRVLDILSRQVTAPYAQLIERFEAHMERSFIGPIEELLRRTWEPYANLVDNLLSDRVLAALESAIRPILTLPPLIHPKARVAATIGWLTHPTLPVTLLDETEDEHLDDAIMAYYRTNWEEVRSTIEANTDQYLIDEDSREVMKQALEAHERQLYRLVPRALLTEIEAVIRRQLRGNKVGSFDMKPEIAKLAEAPISSGRNLSSDLMEYEALEEHLYVNINDEAERKQFADNDIPNRHAAVHGLVPYSSEKSSLNSIFLSDFVLHRITELKRLKILKAVEILSEHAHSLNQGQTAKCPDQNGRL